MSVSLNLAAGTSMDWVRRNFDPSGRTSRLDFWRLQIVFVLAAAMVEVVVVQLVKANLSALAMALFCLPIVAGLSAALAIAIRRMHDRNRSGWWALFFIVLPTAFVDSGIALAASRATLAILLSLPVILLGFGLTFWSWLEFGLFRGTRGANRFGPDPGP